MNFADEHYVKLFTRDTTTWKLWSWQARTVFTHLLRKVDRCGVLDLGGEGLEGLAASLDLPLEIVQAGVPALTRKETVVLTDDRVGIPNFVPAQETPASDAKRARDYRERIKAYGNDFERRMSSRNVTGPSRSKSTSSEMDLGRAGDDTDEAPPDSGAGPESSRNVTGASRNVMDPSRAVTERHAPSLSAVQCSTKKKRSPLPPKGSKRTSKSPTLPGLGPDSAPADAQQADEHADTRNGRDEVSEFWSHWLGHWNRRIGGTRVPSLTDARRRLVRARLKAYSLATLKLAVDGGWTDDWVVRVKGGAIEWILKNAANIDQFADRAPEPEPEPVYVTAPPPLVDAPVSSPDLAAALAGLEAEQKSSSRFDVGPNDLDLEEVG